MSLELINKLAKSIPGAVSVRNEGGVYSVDVGAGWRSVTTAEMTAVQALVDAATAARAEDKADKATLREQFIAASDRLAQIASSTSLTNAQVAAAVRDMATIQRRMLRALYAVLR